jgi:hypothetical protein
MFGLKATEVTPSLCPRNERSRAGSMLPLQPRTGAAGVGGGKRTSFLFGNSFLGRVCSRP